MNTCDYIMCYSPHPRKGLVLFRRNSKEIPSQSTRWKHNHNAVWNERISIHSDVNFSQICTQNPILMSMSNRYGTKRAFISNFAPRVSLSRCNAEMSYRMGICATCSDRVPYRLADRDCEKSTRISALEAEVEKLLADTEAN